jgi:diacylglycerol kinase family enzyme
MTMNTTSNNTTFIICNPTAGAGSAARKWVKFERRLHRRDLHPDCVFTEYPGHATGLAATCIREGYRQIGVFGGDGTLNEALQGVLGPDDRTPGDLQLIFLAAGSSCDLEKAFPDRVPLNDRLTSGQPYWLDVCKVECRSFAGKSIVRYFLNNSSIGVISLGTHKFNCARGFHLALKRVSMNAAAIAIGLSAIAEYPDIVGELILDTSETRTVRLSNLTVFKTPYFAGGMYLGAQTDLDDGYLNVALIEATSRLKLTRMIPSLYTGTIFRHAATQHIRCRSLVLNSDQPVFVETDGEIIGHPPASYSIIPSAIRIII